VADGLARRLQDGGSLVPTRGRKLVLCVLLAILGCVLAVLAGDDPVLTTLGAVVAVLGVVVTVLVMFGWQADRRTWLAREGIVFETASSRYHVPWGAIKAVTLVGRSALTRVQIVVRDIEEVVATVRRKRRGGRHQTQARVRRLLSFNFKGGCHVEFLQLGLGVDMRELHAALAGYVADPASRAELAALPDPEDMSSGAAPFVR
jgi:hypothetical protein